MVNEISDRIVADTATFDTDKILSASAIKSGEPKCLYRVLWESSNGSSTTFRKLTPELRRCTACDGYDNACSIYASDKEELREAAADVAAERI